jgi:hypothetical protein
LLEIFDKICGTLIFIVGKEGEMKKQLIFVRYCRNSKYNRALN